MSPKILWFFLLAAVIYQAPIWALKTDVKMVQPKAFFTESGNGLFEALDHKQKTFAFQAADFERCGQAMVRRQDSLSYSCTLTLPTPGKVTRLREQLSAKSTVVRFGGTDKKINVRVSDDASQVTFSTEFDETGIDFEVTNFNSEFFKVYAKAAQLVMIEAMNKEPLKIETLESRR